MRWVIAVKMWNMHKKIYKADHVYAIPRKGTAEYDDVIHITKHEKLPSHLHTKAPLPDKVIEQLRQQERDAKRRMEESKSIDPAERSKAQVEEMKRLNARPMRVRLQEQIDNLKADIKTHKNRKTPDVDHIAMLEKMLKTRVDAMKKI